MPVSREKTKQEFKRNLIAVFTLGLSETTKKLWKHNYDNAKSSGEGYSFTKNEGIRFVW